MTDAGTVTVKMALDTSGFTAGLLKAKTEASGIGSMIESALSGKTGGVGKIGEALSAGFADVGKNAVASLGPVGTAISSLAGPIGGVTLAVGGIAIAAGAASIALVKLAADQEQAFM
jgi:hypothetical protein